MHRFLALFLILPACSFKILGDDADSSDADASSGEAPLIGGSTSGGSITGNATTSEVPEGTTGEAPGTTTSGGMITGNATSAASESTGDGGGEPLPEPLLVYVMFAHPGSESGFEGIALWQSGMGQTCEDAPPVSCAETPVIGPPKLLADGVLVGPEAVEAGSRVGVIFPYAHPACAFGCGDYEATILLGLDGDGGGAIGPLPVDLPCSTEEGFVWLGLDFGVVISLQYSVELVVTDRCGVSSQAQKVVFTPT